MFCYRCGAQLPDGAKFCTSCGASQAAPEAPVPSPAAPEAPVPSPAAPASTPVQQDEAPRPRRKRRWVIPLVLALVAVIAGGAFVLLRFVLAAPVPEVMGLTPFEAIEKIQDASDQWSVVVQEEGGGEVSVEDEYDYLFYEVSAVSPSVGERLLKVDGNQQVTVTISKTDKQLAREEALQAEVENSLSGGFLAETYDDQGCFVELAVTRSGKVDEWYYFYENPDYEDPNVEYAKDLAADLESSVILIQYYEDGYLGSVEAYLRPGATDDEIELMRDHIAKVVDEASEFNAANAESLLEHLSQTMQGTDADYLTQWDSKASVEMSATIEDGVAKINETVLSEDAEQLVNEARNGGATMYERTLAYLSTCLGMGIDYNLVDDEGNKILSCSFEANSYDPCCYLSPELQPSVNA